MSRARVGTARQMATELGTTWVLISEARAFSFLKTISVRERVPCIIPRSLMLSLALDMYSDTIRLCVDMLKDTGRKPPTKGQLTRLRFTTIPFLKAISWALLLII